MHSSSLWIAAFLALSFAACADEGGTGQQALHDSNTDAFSGGNTTVFDVSIGAFSQAIPTLDPEHEDKFFIGNAIFNRGWISAPASVVDMDGLGPVYNATNCSSCHFKDGRGRPPEKPGADFTSMLIRLSIPGVAEDGGVIPEPVYGGQLQGNAILGVDPEGRAQVDYAEQSGSYADGETWSLRIPSYRIEDLAYGPMDPATLFSPRVAPQMIGLGLLEAIPEATIRGLADPDDRDQDGISGRTNEVWDAQLQQKMMGRFGWKANQPNVRQQVLGAFNGDMGITSSLFPQDHCTEAQKACSEAKNGGTPELREDFADAVAFYSRTLAVPARRRWNDPKVQRGKELFAQVHCNSCHIETLKTGTYEEIPELSHQEIHPYTDLLLHDMGEGLADGRPDFEANGNEWRTPPLWGIGLFKVVNRHTYYLHDGRARGLAEAILWHGGEAQASRDAFVQMSKTDREALLAFLESL